MIEKYYDGLLNIQTVGDQKGFNNTVHYHRYEPTSYSALKILFENYMLKSSDRVVDFGCGKGRLNFFINYLFHASVVGVEMNKTFYQEAVNNLAGYLKKHKYGKGKIQFYCGLAEAYEIHPADNRFYFFNPFSVQIFINVINNILQSLEEYYRDIELILYYPPKDYIYYLEHNTLFELKDEIKLPGLYESNANERFLIYRLGY